MGFKDNLIHGWNAFRGRSPTVQQHFQTFRPEVRRYSTFNEKSELNAIKNRIALDAMEIDLYHCDTDENHRFKMERKSGLQYCLSVSANIDQSARALKHDFYFSCLDEGEIAVCVTESDVSPDLSNSFDVKQLRVAQIVAWSPDYVNVKIYDDTTGEIVERVYAKRNTVILENPFKIIMNSPSSIVSRLNKAISQLDYVDELSSSGKLDLIIQLPYSVRNDARQAQAEKARERIEMQLKDNKYGIAYIDSTEHITQLNRSIDNQLLNKIKELRTELYNSLYMTPEILNGTASEEVMTNYEARIILPLVNNFCAEAKRKWLTKTAITQGQSIMAFRDPFRLISNSKLGDLIDKCARNKVTSSNELRSAIGLRPVMDPQADQLSNPNLNQAKDEQFATTTDSVDTENNSLPGEIQNE